MSNLVGSLRGVLTLDTAQWTRGTRLAHADMGALSIGARALGEVFDRLTSRVRNFGLAMTAGVTLPVALAAKKASAAAGDFEAAMNGIQAAMVGVDPSKIEALGEAARRIGPAMGLSATEAAGAVENLALAGMSAGDILEGGLTAAMRMAKANAGELGEAANLTSDLMAQFGLRASELPTVVDRVTGALDKTKFAFQDYQLAAAQAGGVAGASGLTFQEFNAAIAATAPLFQSGSDAGTSFKTFLQSLNPKSKEATKWMTEMKLSFYDSAGAVLPLAERVERLRQAFAGLSDQQRSEALTAIFGSDAQRTAIPFINMGDRIVDLMKEIDQVSAQTKIDIRMEGSIAAGERLAATMESVKIAIGGAGIIQAITTLKNAMASAAQTFADAPKWFHQFIAFGALAAAAIGPLTLAILGIARLGLPLFFARLGLVGRAIAVLVNPVGVLASTILRLAAASGILSVAARTMALSLARFAGPIGIAITLVTLLASRQGQARQASAAYAQATEQLREAQERAEAAIDGLNTATDEQRDATRRAAVEARAKALADMQAAKAALTRALQERRLAIEMRSRRMQEAATDLRGAGGGDLAAGRLARAQSAVDQANTDAATALRTFEGYINQVDALTQSITTSDARVAVAPRTIDMSEAEKDKSDRSRATGPTAEELRQRLEEMRLEQEIAESNLRNDREREQSAQDQLDLIRQTTAYEDAGLSKAAARVAAERDLTGIRVARAQAAADEAFDAQKDFELTLAQADEDETGIRRLERAIELRDRIERHYARTRDLAEATALAEAEQLRMDEVRDRIRVRWLARDAAARDIELARSRGDSEARVRQLERDRRAEERARELQADGGLSPEAARARALAEGLDDERAYMQGTFRDAFKGGFQAALSGDFGGFFKNWMADRATRGMEDALNNIADSLMKLFQQAFSQGGGQQGGGGGFLSSIMSLFGGSRSAGIEGRVSSMGSSNLAGLQKSLPAFATGGSFRVGGSGGIDTSLVAFRATPGEMVDIRRPGHERQGGIARIVPSPYFDVVVDDRATAVARPMAQSAATAGSAGAQRAMVERDARRLRG